MDTWSDIEAVVATWDRVVGAEMVASADSTEAVVADADSMGDGTDGADAVPTGTDGAGAVPADAEERPDGKGYGAEFGAVPLGGEIDLGGDLGGNDF